jgi:hypothetical protein
MRVLVCGDRNWTDEAAIARVLFNLPADTVLIHGAARGADSIAGRVGERLGFEVLKFPADWEKFGRAAGPIRNQQMLDEGKPDLVIAFHPNLAASKGTKDMVKKARKHGIKVIEYGHREMGCDPPLATWEDSYEYLTLDKCGYPTEYLDETEDIK